MLNWKYLLKKVTTVEKDRIEMQRMIDAEINQLEVKHQLFVAGKEYEAKARLQPILHEFVSKLRRKKSNGM